MFNVSGQKIGRIANKLEIKTEEFGKFFLDKSPYSSKEVQTFKYNQKGINRIKEEFKASNVI